MGIFDRFRRQNKTDSAPKTEEQPKENSAEPVSPAADTGEDENTVSAEEQKMLDTLDRLTIASHEDMESSYLAMRVYRFEKPFSQEDMLALMRGLRWLGMRFYGFTIVCEGHEDNAPSWAALQRSILEDSPERVSAAGSLGGTRVTAVVEREGLVHFSYEAARPANLTAFEGLIEPEEAREDVL